MTSGIRKTNEEFQTEIKDRPFACLDEYAGNRFKLQFRCAVCAHTWFATPNDILNGTGCPPCGARRRGKLKRRYNEVLSTRSDKTVEIDISTPHHPGETMLADASSWDSFVAAGTYGRVTLGPRGRAPQAQCFATQRPGILSRLFMGVTAKGLYVDHKNHNTSDNRLCNLRVCTNAQNNRNNGVRVNSTSGVTGVHFDKRDKIWEAHITVDYKKISLGRYKVKDLAVTARQVAEEKYFGEFSYKNSMGI